MQNDKLEQCVKHRAVKYEVMGSILGSNQKNSFFSPLFVSVIQIMHSYLFQYKSDYILQQKPILQSIHY